MTIRQVRTWFIVAASVFIVLSGAAVAFLLSPAGHSRTARQEQYEALRTELLNKRRENLPARDMDGKLKSARAQVDSFYKDRLPSYYSEISEALGKQAAENHVRLAAVRYDPSRTVGPATSLTGLDRVDLALDVDGNYADEMRFLNSLERSKMFFIPQQITFGGQQDNGNSMRVTLRLQTYMRKNAS